MGYITAPLSVSNVGWQEDRGLRNEMEDGHIFVDDFLLPGSSFFGVFDGHGGKEAMQYCVDYVHQNFYIEMSKDKNSLSVSENGSALTCSDKEVVSALIRSFKKTDMDLIEVGIQSGATACCCFLTKQYFPVINGESDPEPIRTLYTAHLGDARGVLCRSGRAVRLTNMSDHKANCPTERERIHKYGGTVVHDRVNGMLAIARAFGDYQLKAPFVERDVVSDEPDVTTTKLAKTDTFAVLACDGLWDVVSDQQAVTLVLEALIEFQLMGINKDIPQRAELCSRVLVEEALLRGSTDNVTVQIIFF